MTHAEHCQRARKNGPERVMPALCIIDGSGAEIPCSVSGLSYGSVAEMGGFDAQREIRVSIRQDVLLERPPDRTVLVVNGVKLRADTVVDPPNHSSWELMCSRFGKGS